MKFGGMGVVFDIFGGEFMDEMRGACANKTFTIKNIDVNVHLKI